MRKTNKNTSMGMALGMCFGVTLGAGFGQTIFGSAGIGMAAGLGIGMCLGLIAGTNKDEQVNKQIEEHGYTIKSIKELESLTGKERDKEYEVCIVNNANEEQLVTVTKGVMDSEEFAVGNVVYLADDGQIEQAYGEDEDDSGK